MSPEADKRNGGFVRGLRSAFGLLTILPLGPAEEAQPLPYLSYVGLVYGGIAAGAAWTVGRFLHPSAVTSLVCGVATVAVWMLLSGFMHADGLADTADGIGVRGDVSRKLEVMRDSTIGAFGVTAIVLVTLAESAAVGALIQSVSIWPLLTAPVFGRFAGSIALMTCAPARPDGLGARYAVRPSRGDVVVAALPTLALFALAPGVVHAAALAAGAIAGASMCREVSKRLGGITGDVTGAIIIVTEAVVLISAVVGGA